MNSSKTLTCLSWLNLTNFIWYEDCNILDNFAYYNAFIAVIFLRMMINLVKFSKIPCMNVTITLSIVISALLQILPVILNMESDFSFVYKIEVYPPYIR